MDPVLISTSGDELAGPAILDALRYVELVHCHAQASLLFSRNK